MKDEIKKFFKGDVLDDKETLIKYSHDASLFEVQPKLVVFPKDSQDVKNLVKWLNDNKSKYSDLSITARSAGTDMTGGPLNDSIILDFTKYMNKIIDQRSITSIQYPVSVSGIDKDNDKFTITVQPGMYYRDFEKIVSEKGLMMPAYPASKNICALGGMVGNNAGGEKTLKYGKIEDYIEKIKIVLSDGNEYQINKEQTANGFLGEIYRKLLEDVIKPNERIIQEAKPRVSKNSAGYYIWNAWDGQNINLNKLIVGSQGTLGIVTEITLKLVPIKKFSGLFLVFLKDLKTLPILINKILKYKPESLEAYDDKTLKLAMRFFPAFLKNKNLIQKIKFLWSFWPDLLMFLRIGFPKLVLLVEFSQDELNEVNKQINNLKSEIKLLNIANRTTKNKTDSNKYWEIRRESFNLLRQRVQGKRTAPFVDDIIVKPKFLPEVLPALDSILGGYPELEYSIAGHAGDGNFHIIPLVNEKNQRLAEIILDISEKVYDLVIKYGGSITAEHNDGIIRTPYLEKMFGFQMIGIFKKIKEIFDPQNIFNPGKKVGGNIEYIKNHISIK